jgi:uncharacterized protein YukE
MSPYRTIINWITPQEVRPLSNELLKQAQRVRDVARLVRTAGTELDDTWTGGAKIAFFGEFGTLPGDLDQLANSLESKALAIAAITVWEEIKEWFEDPFHRAGN